jgi:hypothetical protein
MTSNVKSAIDAWRRAEIEAREAEALFDIAFTEYTHKRGPAVPAELVSRVSKSRRQANTLLSEALALLKSEVK